MRIYSLHIYRIILPFVAFLYSLTTVGCSDKAALESVEQVLATAEEHPAEALEQIRSIDPNKLHGEHNRARYALAYSEALYYNRIDSDCDTLVEPMMRYYIHHDNNHSERARALYQYALVMDNAERYADALFSLLEADRSLNISEDFKLHGLIYRTMGDIYSKEMLFSNALDAYSLSKEYFDKAGCETHSAYAMLDIGINTHRMRLFEDAETILMETADKAITNGDKHLLCHALYNLCCIYIQTDDYEKCRATIELFDNHDCLLYYHSDYYCFKAIIAAYSNDTSAASYFLSLAENNITEFDALLSHAKYMVAIATNNYQDAYTLYSGMVEQQDTRIISALNFPILNRQIKYLYDKLDSERREQKLINQRNTILYVTISIIILLMYIHWRKTKKEYKNLVTSYLDTIEELRNEQSSMQLSQIKTSALAIYDDYLKDLNKLSELFYTHGGTSREASKVLSAVIDIVDAIRHDSIRLQKLEDITNAHCNNIIKRLRESGTLNTKEMQFVLYTIVGFSSRAIGMLLNCDLDAVSRLRYKVKSKITKENATYWDEIINSERLIH